MHSGKQEGDGKKGSSTQEKTMEIDGTSFLLLVSRQCLLPAAAKVDDGEVIKPRQCNAMPADTYLVLFINYTTVQDSYPMIQGSSR